MKQGWKVKWSRKGWAAAGPEEGNSGNYHNRQKIVAVTEVWRAASHPAITQVWLHCRRSASTEGILWLKAGVNTTDDVRYWWKHTRVVSTIALSSPIKQTETLWQSSLLFPLCTNLLSCCFTGWWSPVKEYWAEGFLFSLTEKTRIVHLLWVVNGWSHDHRSIPSSNMTTIMLYS